MKVVVLMGGYSNEREISLKSGNTVYNALKNKGVDCFKFDLQKDNIYKLWTYKFDKVFIILHGNGGEDGYIQKELQKRNILFTGSDAKSSQLAFDKILTKKLWQKNNIPTPEYVEFYNVSQKIDFSLPWIVKPISEGSSLGVTKINNKDELASAIKCAKKYQNRIMIEKFIAGRELTIAILNEKTLPIIEIKAPNEDYNYNAKYFDDRTQKICPQDLGDKFSKQLQQMALKIFNLCGANVWGRVDLILDNNNEPYFLELNTVPGMTDHSLVPAAAKFSGLSVEQLVLDILYCGKRVNV